MATYQAIAATSQAILGLLEDARPTSGFAGSRFALYRTADFQDPLDDGISLYLYRVSANQTRRNLAPRLAPDGRRYRASLPLDLSYLLTAWAQDAVKQQRLLGWAVRTLEDTPILPAGLLNRYGPEPEIFRPTETVELVSEPLSLADTTALWEVFKPNIEPSVAYLARMIAIESEIEVAEGRPVQTRVFDFAGVEPR